MATEEKSILDVTNSGWIGAPKPGQISTAPTNEPYPIDAFPEIARDAASEVHEYVKAPIPMVACSALTQMALVAQGLSDVARDNRLTSPCSLFSVVTAQSGERKTAVDGSFSQGIQQWESEQREEQLPHYRRGKAMQAALNERRQARIKKIGALEAKGGPEMELERKEHESRLMDLEDQITQLLIDPIPHLYYEDTTTEGLIKSLGSGYPTAMINSSEGGVILGGHSMKDENALQFLAVANKLWDGDTIKQTRKQAGAIDVIGRRFSLSIQIQPDFFEKITEKGGRGSGFLARSLLASPESLMGTRFYTVPPTHMPGLDRFNLRSRELLSLPLPVNDRYELKPPTMKLSKPAHNAWVEYYNSVEKELGVYGEYELVKDVGSKSAENAARIACVFQVWAEGAGGKITIDHMMSGIAVAGWHLTEAARIFFDANKLQEISDADQMSHWLISHAATLTRKEGTPLMDEQGRVSPAEILRYGPHQLRNQQRRDQAFIELMADGINHIRYIKEGKRKLVQVNPWLLNKGISKNSNT
ncbi:MAG: YfjI family protein [Candidatus Thiodiazotropha endolucinida]